MQSGNRSNVGSTMLDRPTFDEQRIPVHARYAAHRLAVLAPTVFANDVDARLADAQYAAIYDDLREVRDAAFDLVVRCEAALRILEGADAEAAPRIGDPRLLVGLRAPIVDALDATIAMNRAWKRAIDETLAAMTKPPFDESQLSEKDREYLRAFIADGTAYVQANERLQRALALFQTRIGA
ncbi:MAG: hypothetical protein JWM87_3747 [Candidatus Eremiobacteraeota bacterium]|nr:hypothetical protein [Candidatus Eremiobacteraeota bacterium]